VAAAGGLALGVVNLRRATRQKAQAKYAVPVSYLLSVRETLAPQTLLSRVMSTISRAPGLRA